jgi:hypothetical protein
LPGARDGDSFGEELQLADRHRHLGVEARLERWVDLDPHVAGHRLAEVGHHKVDKRRPISKFEVQHYIRPSFRLLELLPSLPQPPRLFNLVSGVPRRKDEHCELPQGNRSYQALCRQPLYR